MTELCYKQKYQHLIFCNKCHYFPLSFEITDLTISQNIFGIKWKCPYCSVIVKQPSDKNYRVYSSKGGFVIDQIAQQPYKMTIVILASLQMNDLYGQLPMYPDMLDIVEISKQSMCKQSAMFYAYQNALAAKLRLERGRNFSWNTFIKTKSITKFEYALWFSDCIRANTNANIIICSENGQNIFPSDLNTEYDKKLSSKYIKTRKQENFYNIKSLQLKQFLNKQQSVTFMIGNQSEISLLPALQIIQSQCFILQNYQNPFAKTKIENPQLKNMVFIEKKCFFNEQKNVSTQKRYIEDKINALTEIKYNINIFLKRQTEEWKLVFSKNTSENKNAIVENNNTRKNLKSPQLFGNTNGDKNRNLINLISQFGSSIQQRSISIQKIQEDCKKLANKINLNSRIKILIKLYNQIKCEKTTIMFANYQGPKSNENIASFKQINQQIDIIEQLQAAFKIQASSKKESKLFEPIQYQQLSA